tara:strand:+ start:162 stop:794 length:633 start_codon:yes stop_codon:yes gene_type:complete
MQSEIESIKRLKNPKFKVSCHYLINRNGDVIQMVKERHVAWHAGKSKWKRFKDLNKCSLGIELDNRGHDFGYQNFSKYQIKKLIMLCKILKKKYSIKEENFLGHSDIAPLRKIDPGEKFPWKKLSTHKIGQWFNFDKAISNKDPKIIKNLFFKNLYQIGYRYFSIRNRSLKDKFIIKSFQRHYVPKNVTGLIDQKTFKISQFLTNKFNTS